jgi:hypothetical protein
MGNGADMSCLCDDLYHETQCPSEPCFFVSGIHSLFLLSIRDTLTFSVLAIVGGFGLGVLVTSPPAENHPKS